MRVFPRRRLAKAFAGSATAFALYGCVEDRQVLRQAVDPPSESGAATGGSDGAGGAAGGAGKGGNNLGGRGGTKTDLGGAGGGPGGKPPVWTDCLEALRGADGDACLPEAFPCEFRQGCVVRFAACVPSKTLDGYMLTLGSDDRCETQCKADNDCKSGSWCTLGACRPCAAEETCQAPWELIDRNGCGWCVPPSVCRSDSECGGARCVAGNACPPGCDADPACCNGNLCQDKCPPPEALDCAVVGCKPDSRCIMSEPVKCWCDSAQQEWVCGPKVANFCK